MQTLTDQNSPKGYLLVSTFNDGYLKEGPEKGKKEVLVLFLHVFGAPSFKVNPFQSLCDLFSTKRISQAKADIFKAVTILASIGQRLLSSVLLCLDLGPSIKYVSTFFAIFDTPLSHVSTLYAYPSTLLGSGSEWQKTRHNF